MSWTLNSTPVCSGTLSHPATGLWTATLQTTDDTPPSGAITLSLPGLTLAGVVARRPDGTEDAGIFAERCTVRIVGGAGKLGERIPGQHFSQAPASLIAQSILLACDEQYDPASDAPGLDGLYDHWAYFGGPAGHALDELCSALRCAWWVTAEGLIHLGVLDWLDSDPSGALVLDVRADQRRLLVALEDAPVLPGTTYQGQRVVAVDHELTDRTWRAVVRW